MYIYIILKTYARCTINVQFIYTKDICYQILFNLYDCSNNKFTDYYFKNCMSITYKLIPRMPII